ncbi:MAG: hypothetical protein RI885_2703 [Actinomycetota bacterium]
MSVLHDLKTARRVLVNLWRSRMTRRRIAGATPSSGTPGPATVEVAVYFADADVNLYQIRQWYAPLAELAKTRRVAIISRSPGAALTIFEESPVPVVYLRQVVDLERFIHEQPLKVVLYVNQNSRNFQMMRYSRMWHVFVNHGESDKMYMTTNQFKAYDYSLVAGQAALDRLSRKLWDFDLERRAIPIGRPQADHLGGVLPYTPDDRIVVFYAPTWEGDRASAAYGSIASHGVELASRLVATGRHRVVYRPHPRSGVIDAAYRRANQEIVAILSAANARDSSARHVIDAGAELGWQLGSSDVAITDISAMVYDRLATGRPIVVTRPADPAAEVDLEGFLGDAVWLTAEAASDVVAVVDRALDDEEARDRLEHWVRHHFGDTTPGAATARFHAAIEGLIAEWERHAALHPEDLVGPDGSAGDAEGDDDADDEQVIRRR